MRKAINSLPIRAKIAFAILALSVGTLVVMSLAVYAAFERQLVNNLDDTVRLRASSNLQLIDSTQLPPTLNAGPDPGSERSEGRAVLRLFNVGGEVVNDASPEAGTSPEERALVLRAAKEGIDIYATVDLGSDEDFRVVASPVRTSGTITGVLLTGVERSRVNKPLSVLRIILVIAIPMTSLFLALGSFWIARGALRPVARITTTARQIAAGDLRRRIEGVAAKDEIGELAETLNTMLARLEETVERERRFTADASHELRTPLAAIETSIEVTLSQSRGSAEYRHTLEAVRDQAQRLTSLTRQLLLLSRLDSEQAQREFERVDLRGVVEAVAATFAGSNPQATVSVEGTNEVIEVNGDIELLARAILNILDNAAKHVRPTVSVVVTVSKKPGEGRASVAIADDGPGIPNELAAEVFQRFRRGDTSRSTGGSGLGLSIVDGIMKLHGGEVRLGTSPNGAGGASFELLIPLA